MVVSKLTEDGSGRFDEDSNIWATPLYVSKPIQLRNTPWHFRFMAQRRDRSVSACMSHHPVLQLRLKAFIVGGSAYHRFGMSTLIVAGC